MLISFEPYNCNIDNNKRKELFAEALYKIRKSRGITQTEMSEALGISQQAYYAYEKGKSEPSLENLVRISFILNCSIDLLLQKNNLIGDEKDQLEYAKKFAEEIRALEGNEKLQQSENLSSTLKALKELVKVATKTLEEQNNNKS